MSKIIIFDFEVFHYDVLLGTIIVENDKETIYQTWDKEEIKKFYIEHKTDLWIGHNNVNYDNLILEAVLRNNDVYKVSKSLINAQFRPRCFLDFNNYDVMYLRPFSLKASELGAGKNMHETDVDFDLDRELTDEEKKLTEEYNKDDLKQTLFNLNDTSNILSLKLDLIKEFNLPTKALNWTEAKIAGTVLGCKNIDGIENMKVPPFIPNQLKIKNKEVLDFYMREGFRKGEKLDVMICGCLQHLGSGGIHSALKRIHLDRCLYFDVSGYYNLVMINYDLLPRTCPKEGKELYEYMYHEQLRLKKIDPRKRAIYKTILLAVFGAMMNKYTLLYDPEKGSLVTIMGQLFLIDLLEKLEESGLCYCVQTNTDGLMIEPYDWTNKDAIIKIVEEWEQRTGFTIKKLEIYNLWQRDVNNYVYAFDKEFTSLEVKGEAVNPSWIDVKNSTDARIWELKESIVIAKAIVNYLEHGISPEETIEQHKFDLRYFQQVTKKGVYEYCKYEEFDKRTNEFTEKYMPNYNRVFASNNPDIFGMIYKCKKDKNGKQRKDRPASLSPSIFVYNDEILSEETRKELLTKIDFQYYINRAKERIREFKPDYEG